MEASTATFSAGSRPEARPKKRKNTDVTSEFLAQASAALNRKPDDYDGFAIVVSNKLKQMNAEQKQLSELLLLQVLHRGVNGRLTDRTRLEEEQPFIPTPSVSPIPQPFTWARATPHYPPGERPSSHFTVGERPVSYYSAAERPASHYSAGERPASHYSAGERPASQPSSGEMPSSQWSHDYNVTQL